MHAKVVELVREAKLKQLWIYEPTTKQWYSPEDFLRAFGNAFNPVDELCSTVQLRHPVDGIVAGIKVLQNARNKLNALTNAVMKYYGELPK